MLWTSYQGKWTGWTGGLGHDQIISDCKSVVMNGECVLTSNKNYINSADVVLFSLQDLKQVFISIQKVHLYYKSLKYSFQILFIFC